MTTATWTASAPATPAQNITVPGVHIFGKIGRTCGFILRCMFNENSDYLGLDLNGSPIWVKHQPPFRQTKS